MFLSCLLLVALSLPLIGISIYLSRLRQTVTKAPRLLNVGISANASLNLPSVSVIVPAFNEANNIEACLTSILASSQLPSDKLEVWVVDDQSIDKTLTIVRTLQDQLNDPRLKILAASPRPQNEVWMGKNWACTQAAEQAKGEFLLFLDADVRLKPGAIESALQAAEQEQTDLLTCWPQIVCGCLAEWLVQPLMASMLASGFDFNQVNDAKTDVAFAAGPFMLFRRTAYEQLGGHRAVASQVVEDVELARRVKATGLKLWYALGSDLAAVRMYSSFGALWEGWTKNWYLGSRCNLSLTLSSAVIVLLVCTLPWVGLILMLLKGTFLTWNVLDLVTGAIVLYTLWMHYQLRQVGKVLSAIPVRYWWLTGVGGALVAAIALASIIKTETGWGWTWRGRTLQRPEMP